MMKEIIITATGGILLLANPFFYFWGLQQIMHNHGKFWVPAVIIILWLGSLLVGIGLISCGRQERNEVE